MPPRPPPPSPPPRHRPHGGAPPPPLHPPKANQRLLSLLLKTIIMILLTSLFFIFLGFATIILFSLCLAGRRAFHHSNRHRLIPECNSSSGLSPQDLKRVPQFRYGKTRQGEEEEEGVLYQSECVVCLDKLREGQLCRRLVGCNHVFHRRCVDVWLVKKAACPVCRRPVRSSGSSSSCSVPEDCRLWWWDLGRDNNDLNIIR